MTLSDMSARDDDSSVRTARRLLISMIFSKASQSCSCEV